MSDKTIARRVFIASSDLVNKVGYTAFNQVLLNSGHVKCAFGLPYPDAGSSKLAEPYSYSPLPNNGYDTVENPVAYLHDFRRTPDGIYALISPVEGCTNKTFLKALAGTQQTFKFVPRVILKKAKLKTVNNFHLQPSNRDFHQIITFDMIWK
ncbi:hypothetical protein TOTORO_01340 [Serratia phage vB_SmaS-Totoro]|nr:hypothetical protein TOTORO_01340 [Serratia phage vB_SmaS-Totoro]